MDFIKNHVITILLSTVILLVISVGILLYAFTNVDEATENRDKTLISNVLINAIRYGDIEEANTYYDNLVSDGVIAQDVRDEYFNFDELSVNSMWGRFDAGGTKDVTIVLNTKLNEGVTEDNVYLTVVSYRYPITRDDLGHNQATVAGGEELYYRNNTVVISQVSEGKLTNFRTLPEQTIVSNVSEVSSDDFDLFEEQLEPIDFDSYVEDLQHGQHGHE